MAFEGLWLNVQPFKRLRRAEWKTHVWPGSAAAATQPSNDDDDDDGDDEDGSSAQPPSEAGPLVGVVLSHVQSLFICFSSFSAKNQ